MTCGPNPNYRSNRRHHGCFRLCWTCSEPIPSWAGMFTLPICGFQGCNPHVDSIWSKLSSTHASLRSSIVERARLFPYCPWASSWAEGRRRRLPAQPWRCPCAPSAPPSPCGRWSCSSHPNQSPGAWADTKSGWYFSIQWRVSRLVCI